MCLFVARKHLTIRNNYSFCFVIVLFGTKGSNLKAYPIFLKASQHLQSTQELVCFAIVLLLYLSCQARVPVFFVFKYSTAQ